MDSDIESRLLAGESVDKLAADIGGAVVDASDVDWEGADVEGDCLALPGWVADDGNAEVEYPAAESGYAAAEEYVSDGDWGESDSTTWIVVRVWQVAVAIDTDGEYVTGTFGRNSRTVEVEPTEPKCPDGPDGEHEWASDHGVVGGCESNPGVQGSGGGVLITKHCRHCGVYRVTDTWAQNPATGERGLRSVSYREADEASLNATEVAS